MNKRAFPIPRMHAIQEGMYSMSHHMQVTVIEARPARPPLRYQDVFTVIFKDKQHSSEQLKENT